MHGSHGNRAFADGGRDALDIVGAHVADREHAGQDRFKQIRLACKRPVRRGQIVFGQVVPGLDKALRVERDVAAGLAVLLAHRFQVLAAIHCHHFVSGDSSSGAGNSTMASPRR